ncbi:MAG: hypothetical protein AB7G23_03050 [Vicinamibacterales bacterium]
MACRRLLLVLLLLVPAPVAAQTVRFLDQCAASSTEDLVVLMNHTLTVGVAWTEAEDTGADNNISAFQATSTCGLDASDTSDRLAYTMTPTTPSSADYDVGFSLPAVITGQTDLDPVVAFVRWQDTSNWYACLLTAETTPRWVLLKRLSGTTTVLDSGNSAATTNSSWQCLIAGDTLKVLVDSAEEGCAVDSSITDTGAGAVGFGNYWPSSAGGDDLADANTSWKIDNIAFTDQTGQGLDDNCGVAAGGGIPKTTNLLLKGVGE